jgi:succinoglycan biosynthesis transport protein ExoP
MNARLEEVSEHLKQLPPEQKPDSTAGSSGDDLQLQLIDRDIRRLNDEQRRLEGQMAMYRARIDAAPIREQQMLDLARNYDVTSKEYENLLAKTTASEQAAELERRQKGERFTVVDRAQPPERPFKPKRQLLLLASWIAALFVSVAGAVTKEILSGSIKTEEELAQILPSPSIVITTVPAIESAELVRRDRVFAAIGFAAVAVACAAEILLWLKIKPIL